MAQFKFVAWVNEDNVEAYNKIAGSGDVLIIGDGLRTLDVSDFDLSRLSKENKDQIDENTQFIFFSHGGIADHGDPVHYTFSDKEKNFETVEYSAPRTGGIIFRGIKSIESATKPAIHIFSCYSADFFRDTPHLIHSRMKLHLPEGSSLCIYGNHELNRTIPLIESLDKLLNTTNDLGSHASLLYEISTKLYINTGIFYNAKNAKDVAQVQCILPSELSLDKYNDTYSTYAKTLNKLLSDSNSPVTIATHQEKDISQIASIGGADIQPGSEKDIDLIIESQRNFNTKIAVIFSNYGKFIHDYDCKKLHLAEHCITKALEVLSESNEMIDFYLICNLLNETNNAYWKPQGDNLFWVDLNTFQSRVKAMFDILSDKMVDMINSDIISDGAGKVMSNFEKVFYFNNTLLNPELQNFVLLKQSLITKIVDEAIIPNIDENTDEGIVAAFVSIVHDQILAPQVLLPMLHKIIYREDGIMRVSQEAKKYICGKNFDQYHDYVYDQYDAPDSAFVSTDIWDRDMDYFAEHGRFRDTLEVIGDVVQDTYQTLTDACVIL